MVGKPFDRLLLYVFLFYNLLYDFYNKEVIENVKIEGISIIMNSFTERAIGIIKNIPEGKVMTYGQIASLAGSPRAARQVVRILHSMSKKHRLPWHRVINSKGEIGIQDDESLQEQIFSLESEGVEIQNNKRIDLQKYQYQPESQ
jgi:methylated-DNA-protein-cysteine methyltransferase related protein